MTSLNAEQQINLAAVRRGCAISVKIEIAANAVFSCIIYDSLHAIILCMTASRNLQVDTANYQKPFSERCCEFQFFVMCNPVRQSMELKMLARSDSAQFLAMSSFFEVKKNPWLKSIEPGHDAIPLAANHKKLQENIGYNKVQCSSSNL